MLAIHETYKEQREWCEQNAQGDCSTIAQSDVLDYENVSNLCERLAAASWVFVHESQCFVSQGRYKRHVQKTQRTAVAPLSQN